MNTPFIFIMYYDTMIVGEYKQERYEIVFSPENSREVSKETAQELIASNSMVLTHSNKYGKVWELSQNCPYKRKYGRIKRERKILSIQKASI